MSDEPSREKSVQELIAEAELRKLNAEAQKTELEREEVQKRLQEKWFLGPSLIKVIVAGLVAGAAIIVWFLSVGGSVVQNLSMLRALEKEEREQLRIETERNKEANEFLRAELERSAARLTSSSQRYKQLSENNELMESERARFEQLYRETELETDKLAQELERLRSLQDFDVVISFDHTNNSVPWPEIRADLENAGATTGPDNLVPPLGERPAIWYYSDADQEKARLVQIIVGRRYGHLPIRKGRPSSSSRNVIRVNLWPR